MTKSASFADSADLTSLKSFTPRNAERAPDIDWTKPISGIDQQLYKKYGLNDEEIAFIESMIRPME